MINMHFTANLTLHVSFYVFHMVKPKCDLKSYVIYFCFIIFDMNVTFMDQNVGK